MMSGCEIIKCVFYSDGKCTDETEFVNRYTGEPICRHNEDAVLKEDESNMNLLFAAAPEMYEALKIVNDFLLDIADEGDDCFKLVLNSVGYALAKAEGREGSKC